jgi:phospholipid/cholesterol/gamma-HCH transport system substrate-binding protein
MILLRAKVQVLVFAVVGLLGITYVGVRYIGIFASGYTVYVDLPQAGGIFANAAVTYRGVPVGRVRRVSLHDGGARATLRVDQGVRVPADLHAVVAQRSAVGEQYLDLRPDSADGPFLHNGSVIPRDRTGVPLAPETLLTNLDALVQSVGPDNVAVVIAELGAAFEGSETALHNILDSGQLLLDDATANLPQTVDLIRDGQTVLATQQASAGAIRQWADGLARLAATIRGSDGDLRKLLVTGPPAAQQLEDLLNGLEPSIGTLLGNLVSLGDITARRLPGIEQLLVVYPVVVAGGFTVTPGDGTAHFGLVLNVNDPPPCTYTGHQGCSAADLAHGSGVRSAANAPRPGGSSAPPPASSGAGGSGSGGNPAAPAGYDPVTGLVLGPDGLPLQFGGTGGQAALAGGQSWKQLLLAGITP